MRQFFVKKSILVFCMSAVVVLGTGILAQQADATAARQTFEQVARQTKLNTGAQGATGAQTLQQRAGDIVRGVLQFIGIIFLLLLIVAGIMWMTAFGEPKKIEKAKSIITSAIVGLLLTIFTYAITSFIFTILSSDSAGGGGGGGGAPPSCVHRGQTCSLLGPQPDCCPGEGIICLTDTPLRSPGRGETGTCQ